MKWIFILFSLSLFLFSGCTSKSDTLSLKSKPFIKTDTSVNHIAQKEEVSDEFEEEFSTKETHAYSDPFSGYNRFMTSFNDKVFTYALNPFSKAYATVIPEPVRQSLSNAIVNIEFPIRFSNNLLQGKFKNSMDELGRFVLNSTLGVGGLFDVASSQLHIPAHNEDFGQTLGYYGVGAGFHVVLPFLGPSNVRDIVGLTADAYVSPLVYQKGLKKYKIPHNYLQSIGIYGFKMLNKNTLHLGAYESLKKDAIDLYPFLRDIYEQKRKEDIEN